jgi:hypothetical protein
MDSGLKLAAHHYFYGGTWSPNTYADYNTFKFFGSSMLAAFSTSWAPIPLEVARVNILKF